MTSAARLEVLRQLLDAAAEEMGEALMRSAASTNIKERRDHSCAVLTPDAQLVAQAEHIPVHLGSMAASARGIVDALGALDQDAVAIANDPYHGGTHLPDITMVRPVHVGGDAVALLACRAHHADIGGTQPGSMPAGATRLEEEGVIIEPALAAHAGDWVGDARDRIVHASRTPEERRADLDAQLGCLQRGATRITDIVERWGRPAFAEACADLLDHSERLMRSRLVSTPNGSVAATDVLDDDGAGGHDIPIEARVTIDGDDIHIDLTGTADQVRGNLNAPRPVTEAAVQYVLRLIVGRDVPPNAGAARPVRIDVRPGSLLDPRPGAAVAGGNVETSQRIVDVLLRALAGIVPERVPAASQGTMNNLAIGGTDASGRAWAYYETIGGGEGATPDRHGQSGIHTHMTNTRNTPVEALELDTPLLVRSMSLRRGTGGAGRHDGGEGILREIELREGSATATLLTERRQHRPWGLQGGGDGAPGTNTLVSGGRERAVPAKGTVDLRPGDRVRIETPGGGGWGPRDE